MESNQDEIKEKKEPLYCKEEAKEEKGKDESKI